MMTKTKEEGELVLKEVSEFLDRRLHLKVNVLKSKVVPIRECEFLGFTFKAKKIFWTPRAYADFRHRIKELTGRSWGVSMEYRLEKLRLYVRGWINYFGISEHYAPIPGIDEWIRRRIRMCL